MAAKEPTKKNETSFWEKVSSWLPAIFADERFDRIRLEPGVVEDICALARGSHPQEMVAFLTGSIKEEREREGKEANERNARVLVIDGLYVKGYDADEYSTHFTTHDLPLTGVFGTVHSHPGWSNRPSAADRQLFSHHGYFHLIVCQPYRRSSIAAYGKHGEPIAVEF